MDGTDGGHRNVYAFGHSAVQVFDVYRDEFYFGKLTHQTPDAAFEFRLATVADDGGLPGR